MKQPKKLYQTLCNQEVRNILRIGIQYQNNLLHIIYIYNHDTVQCIAKFCIKKIHNTNMLWLSLDISYALFNLRVFYLKYKLVRKKMEFCLMHSMRTNILKIILNIKGCTISITETER